MDATELSLSAEASSRCTSAIAGHKQRRRKDWPTEARRLVSNHLDRLRGAKHDATEARAELLRIITRLVDLTGYSQESCWRFARRLGAGSKQQYREWTKADQQRLLDLAARNPLFEVAKIIRRSPGSVRAMLHRLGASAQMGRDWFTLYTLAEALHIRATEVQRWIDCGWLKTRTVETGRLKREIIEADCFDAFCEEHASAVVGRRLNPERLEFVRMFVFAPKHTELLPVRESKKERAAFDSLLGTSERSQRTENMPEASENMAAD